MTATDPGAASNDASPIDTGLASLVMLARFHQVSASPEQLAHEFSSGDALQPSELLLAAKKLGLKAKFAKVAVDRLDSTPLPAIAQGADGQFFIVARLDQGKVLIHDPRSQHPEIITIEDLVARWAGRLLFIRTGAGNTGESSRFDFTWFIPAVVKYRKLLGEVLLVSFVLQIFSLITPLFFQVVMDKVLVHYGLTTLDVIAIGLAGVMLFESGLSGLRSYVFAHTASRIDVELGSKLFRQPIMRLAQLWTNFQQTGVSVQRLGDILNTRTELTQATRSTLPPIKGRIEFDEVHFRYRADGSEILRGISLAIEAGEVIGVVGRSGSGKSTLTRLLRRLYVPEWGRVLVDGMDLALADVSSLRRQIGVVLQDNMLFNRSIQENIALSDPGVPLEAVIEVARLAGAHEFILELPEC